MEQELKRVEDVWKKAVQLEKAVESMEREKLEAIRDRRMKELLDERVRLLEMVRKEREERQRLESVVRQLMKDRSAQSSSGQDHVEAKEISGVTAEGQDELVFAKLEEWVERNTPAPHDQTDEFDDLEAWANDAKPTRPASTTDKVVATPSAPSSKKISKGKAITAKAAAPSSYAAMAAKSISSPAAAPSIVGPAKKVACQAPSNKTTEPPFQQKKKSKVNTPMARDTVTVPADQIGRVIGKGRRNAESLEKKFCVKIEVPPTTSIKSDVTIVVSGADAQNCKDACDDIWRNVQITVFIPLGKRMIPFVIGKGGQTIRSLSSKHGPVHMEMPDDTHDHPGKMRIHGPRHSVEAVRNEVQAIIEKSRRLLH